MQGPDYSVTNSTFTHHVWPRLPWVWKGLRLNSNSCAGAFYIVPFVVGDAYSCWCACSSFHFVVIFVTTILAFRDYLKRVEITKIQSFSERKHHASLEKTVALMY